MDTNPLFCKPFPDMKEDELLFLFTEPVLKGKIAFRSLQLNTDLNTIHEWVNQPYSRRYWQMNMDKQSLSNAYAELLNDPRKHSYAGLFDDRIVCLIEIYQVAADELGDHVLSDSGNCGLHILMLPPRQSFNGLPESMLKAFIRFYFSFGAAGTLYAEPDARNTAANILAMRVGFDFLRTITISYKTANLYSITREQFFNSNNYAI